MYNNSKVSNNPQNNDIENNNFYPKLSVRNGQTHAHTYTHYEETYLQTSHIPTRNYMSALQSTLKQPPLPKPCAHSVPSISRISLFLLCMTSQLEPLSILKPYYITGSVLAHSISHSVSLSLNLSPFLPPFSLSSVQRTLSPACIVLGGCLPNR